MRTVNATLLAALQAGTGSPFVKAYVGYTNGQVKFTATPYRYVLTGQSLELEIPNVSDFNSDQEAIWLERGLTIAGVDYTLTTSRFFIHSQEYLDSSRQIVKGGLFPKQFYSANGNDTYQNVINAFCTAYGKTAVYRSPGDAWLGYKFLPAGKLLRMNDANYIHSILQQKRMIVLADNGAEQVLVYCADVMGAADATVAVKDDFSLSTTKLRKRQYLWTDELGVDHQSGGATDPVNNLGYLESTDAAPARTSSTFEARAAIRPDLRFLDGDVLTLSFFSGAFTANVFAQISEEFDAAKKMQLQWKVTIEANTVFKNTDGGQIPRGIEQTANYLQVNTSQFNNVLSKQDSNIQRALDDLDNKTRLKLTANRTVYVRKDIGVCTMTIASPCVVTKVAHGLSLDDPVVFKTTGALPTGLTQGTVYYVISAGLTADAFEVSPTKGGAAVNTSGTQSGTHNLATGNDANDGSAADRTHALLTIQKGVDLAAALDTSIYAITVQAADGYFKETVTCKNPAGSGAVTVQGNTATPANCIFDGTIQKTTVGNTYNIYGFRFATSAADLYAIYATGEAYIVTKNCTFGSGYVAAHMLADNNSIIEITGNYTIEAGSSTHIQAQTSAVVRTNGTLTVTLSATPNFTTAFANVTAMAYAFINSTKVTFSGAATGKRYQADLNSVINTVAGGLSYLPGNAAGSTASGAQYA